MSFPFVCVMVFVCFVFSTSIFAGSVGAAKSRVMQAQDYVDKGQKDNAQDKLNEAEKFLDGLTDAEKAPIEKDIAALRAKWEAEEEHPQQHQRHQPQERPTPKLPGGSSGTSAGI